MSTSAKPLTDPTLDAVAADLAVERPERISRSSDGLLVREIARRSGGVVRSAVAPLARVADDPAVDDSPADDDPAADFDHAFLRTAVRPDYASGVEPVRVVDLFSGCGAMSLGIAEACRALGRAFVPVAACDVNATALGVYAANFGIAPPPTRDLGELSSLIDGVRTPAEVSLAKVVKDVDVVVAGPPCQGHSNLNNVTRRNDPKNGLYFKVARFAKLFAPKFVMIENVLGVVRDQGAVVPRTMRALEELGYRVKAGTVDMSRLGVAQTRRRHVVLAFRQDIPFRLPDVDEIARGHRVPTTRTLRWAIGDLEGREREGDLLDGPSGMKEVTRARIKLLVEEGRHELPNEHRPDCHRTKTHTYKSVYGRMHWDRPGPTVTGGFDTMGQGRFVHPSQERTMTPHEAARVQFIPDFFDFRSVQRRTWLTEIIGNAVPPKLSYVFGVAMLR